MTHSEQLLLADFFHCFHPCRILLVNSRIRSRQKPVNYERGSFATHSLRAEKRWNSQFLQGLKIMNQIFPFFSGLSMTKLGKGDVFLKVWKEVGKIWKSGHQKGQLPSSWKLAKTKWMITTFVVIVLIPQSKRATNSFR